MKHAIPSSKERTANALLVGFEDFDWEEGEKPKYCHQWGDLIRYLLRREMLLPLIEREIGMLRQHAEKRDVTCPETTPDAYSTLEMREEGLAHEIDQIHQAMRDALVDIPDSRTLGIIAANWTPTQSTAVPRENVWFCSGYHPLEDENRASFELPDNDNEVHVVSLLRVDQESQLLTRIDFAITVVEPPEPVVILFRQGPAPQTPSDSWVVERTRLATLEN